jgi:hypothetical protein
VTLRNDIRDRVRGLLLDGVDVILCKDRYIWERIKSLKFPELKRRIYVAEVGDFDNLQALDEKKMNAAGWYFKGIDGENIKD